MSVVETSSFSPRVEPRPKYPSLPSVLKTMVRNEDFSMAYQLKTSMHMIRTEKNNFNIFNVLGVVIRARCHAGCHALLGILSSLPSSGSSSGALRPAILRFNHFHCAFRVLAGFQRRRIPARITRWIQIKILRDQADEEKLRQRPIHMHEHRTKENELHFCFTA